MAGTGAGDPLSPNFVGETMSTGMDLGLVQQAKEAGIITSSNPLYGSVSGPSSTSLGTPQAGVETNYPSLEVMAEHTEQNNEAQNINVTGSWSLDLTGDVTRHIELILIQNRDAIMGNGALTGDNDTARITASGLLTGNRLSLTVMPISSLDLYKLDLTLDPQTEGSYTYYSAGGTTQSGDVSGTASIDTTVPIYQAPGAEESTEANADNPDANGSSAGSLASPYKSSGYEPVKLGGGSAGGFSSSKSISMVSGGGFSSSSSSMSVSM